MRGIRYIFLFALLVLFSGCVDEVVDVFLEPVHESSDWSEGDCVGFFEGLFTPSAVKLSHTGSTGECSFISCMVVEPGTIERVSGDLFDGVYSYNASSQVEWWVSAYRCRSREAALGRFNASQDSIKSGREAVREAFAGRGVTLSADGLGVGRGFQVP